MCCNTSDQSGNIDMYWLGYVTKEPINPHVYDEVKFSFQSIECFHSRDQHLCKFIGTKESICIRKEFNSHRTGLGHQHGHRFIVLGHQYGRHGVMCKHYHWKEIYCFCFVLLCIWGQFSKYKPPGRLYLEGRLTEGFCVTGLGGLYMERLIFGI